MASNSDRYAFIGLGAMGLPMAINLQKYLSSNSFAPLVVYNRTFSKTHAVKEIGAIAATSLKQVIEYANIIFTSLANDNAVNQTFNELLSESDLIDNNKKKIIFVETSTIEPTTVGTLREKVENTTNRILLYCPVLGPPEVAKNAMLSIIPSGNQDAINYMLPLLTTVLGKKVLPAGDDVKNAAKFKLIGNLFVFGAGELLSEGLTLAEKSGVDKEMLLNFISSPEFITNVYRRYGTKMIKENFETDVGFTVTNALKDIGHIQQLAKDTGTYLPLADLVYKNLNNAKENESGGDNYDWSSMIGALRVASGLSFINKNAKHE